MSGSARREIQGSLESAARRMDRPQSSLRGSPLPDHAAHLREAARLIDPDEIYRVTSMGSYLRPFPIGCFPPWVADPAKAGRFPLMIAEWLAGRYEGRVEEVGS
jgi:hypothetical protein